MMKKEVLVLCITRASKATTVEADIMEAAAVPVLVPVPVLALVEDEQDAREKIFTEQNFIRKIFTMH